MASLNKKKNRASNISSFSARRKTLTHLYTKGGEFSLDGEEYVGEYHIEGIAAFTGPAPLNAGDDVNQTGDPDIINPKLIIVAPKNTESRKRLRRIYLEKYQYDYERIKSFDIAVLGFVDPVPYIYEPTDAAYEVGQDSRYFVQKRGDDSSYAIEINNSQWELLGLFGGIDDGLYSFASITWRLVGSYDVLAQQNELALYKAQKVVPSILYSVKSFTEFARFTRF